MRRINRRSAVSFVALMAIAGPQVMKGADARLHGGAASGVTPPSGNLPFTFTLNNLSATNSYTAPNVSYGHPFADGDIPASGSVTLTDSNGNPVTVQMDGVSTWPSGCVKWANLSHACAETFGTSSSKTYTLNSSNTPPDNTLAIGWGANLAAALNTFKTNTNFKVEYSGFDAGASTYTVSANAILTNFNNITSGWGASYPLGGWEVTKQGPVCFELHMWQYLRNDSGAAPQGYVRCDMWIKAWSPTGPFEIDVATNMPNMWNAVTAGSEQRGVLPGRFAALVRILNGVTVVSYQGGANDVVSSTVLNSKFNTSNNQLTASNDFYPQGAVYFTSTVSLPAGNMAANTLYWPAYYWNNGGNAYLMKERAQQAQIELGNLHAWSVGSTWFQGDYVINSQNIIYKKVNPGSGTTGVTGPTGTGNGIVDGTCTWDCISVQFTNQGSGTITANYVPACFPSCGWAAQDGLGDPLWVGSGSRPAISPGHNFNYLTQKSTFTLPLNAAADTLTTNLALPTRYHPMMHLGGAPQWSIDITGDGVGDQRVGFMPEWGHCAIYMPTDRFYNTIIKQEALSMLTFPLSFANDESGGHPFIGNNGTNDNGVAYTNFPSLLPGFNAFNAAGAAATTTVARGNTWGGWSFTDKDYNGAGGQYYYSSPHMPSLWQVPYLKTGRPIFLYQGMQQMNVSCVWTYTGTQTLSGHTYRCVQGATIYAQQIRGWGWGLRCLTQGFFITPDSHPQQPYFRDLYDDNAKYQALRLAGFPANQGVFGFLPFADPPDDPSHGIQAPWQGYFCMLPINTEGWRQGQTSAARTNSYYTTMMNYYGNFWKLFQASVNPNACNYISLYRIIYSPNPNDFANCYTNAATCLAATQAAGWGGPSAPYITIPFDNDGVGQVIGTQTNSSNWYGNPARCAMVTHLKADPTNTIISGVLANFTSKIAARTGVSTSLGGYHWGYTQGGVTQNALAFPCW